MGEILEDNLSFKADECYVVRTNNKNVLNPNIEIRYNVELFTFTLNI